MEYYKSVIVWKREKQYFARVPCQCKLYTEKLETAILPLNTYRVVIELWTEDCEARIMRPSDFRWETADCHIDIDSVDLLKDIYVVEGDSPLSERVSYSKKKLSSSFPSAAIEKVEVDGHLDEDDCARYGRPGMTYDEEEGLSDGNWFSDPRVWSEE